MKKHFVLMTLVLTVTANCSSGEKEKSMPLTNPKQTKEAHVIYLTNETFKQQVFDYDLNKEWKYTGTLPAIIDFYADWCGPCKKLSPVIEELAKEYHGRLLVFKVDTEKERLLSQNIGVQALPTILLIPVEGHPQTIMGALPKSDLIKAIQEVLLK